MTKDEALKMALEALELVNIEFVCNGAHHAKKDRHELGDECPVTNRYRQSITAIKEALSEPKQDYPENFIHALAFHTVLSDLEPEQEPVAWVYPEGLEALKAGKPWTAYGTRQEPDNTALYLSPQPDIAPYAWVTFTPYGDEDDVWYENPEGQLLEGWTYKPLYDTTPPQRTWVGLTQTQVKLLWEGVEEEAIKSGDSLNWVFYTHINEALKEKNT